MLVQRMEAIVRKLPISPEKEELASDAAELVVTSAYINEEHPPRGDKAAISSLGKLAKHFQAIVSCLQDLPQEAFQALFDELDNSEIGFDYEHRILALVALRDATVAAKARLEAKTTKKKGGAPTKYRAANVAQIALGCYEALTSSSAGVTVHSIATGHPRSGEFLEFLTDVFDVLGIRASPSSQASQAIAKRSIDGKAFMATLSFVRLSRKAWAKR